MRAMTMQTHSPHMYGHVRACVHVCLHVECMHMRVYSRVCTYHINMHTHGPKNLFKNIYIYIYVCVCDMCVYIYTCTGIGA